MPLKAPASVDPELSIFSTALRTHSVGLGA
jgi:hypothetical protein